MRTQLTIPELNMRRLLEDNRLTRYEDFIDREMGELIQTSGTSQIRRIALARDGLSEWFFLKVYRYGSDRPRSALRRDRGSTEARNYQFLREQCGIDVPDVVAFGYRRSAWKLVDSFILTRAVEGAQALEGYSATRRSDRSRLLIQTADIVRKMHDGGFFHIDLQWRNLLIRPFGDGFQVVLIDSARGGPRSWSIGREHGRIRDLSSLAKEAVRRLSRTERIRWLRRYLRAPKLGEIERNLIRTIEIDRATKDNSRPTGVAGKPHAQVSEYADAL